MRKTWATAGWAKAAALVLAACCAQPAAAVNKCTGKDGAVVYQDAPCSNAAASGAKVKTWSNTPGDGGQRLELPAPQPIKWPGDPDTDAMRIEALLDSMRTQGRDCEWALKVTRGASIAQRCVPFMGMLQEGGDFTQVNDRLQQLTRDREWATKSLPTLRRCTSLMQDVVKQKELMMAHLGVR